MNVGEQMSFYRYRREWVSYRSDFVVLWQYQYDGANVVSREMQGLYAYGEVTSRNIRRLPWKLIETADPADFPRWDLGELNISDHNIGAFQPRPPTLNEVSQAWQDRGAPLPGKPWPEFSPRQPGETVEDFYQRVADGYRSAAVTGKPTLTIAERAGVPKSTASRWIREARRRGYLAKTTQGKVNR